MIPLDASWRTMSRCRHSHRSNGWWWGRIRQKGQHDRRECWRRESRIDHWDMTAVMIKRVREKRSNSEWPQSFFFRVKKGKREREKEWTHGFWTTWELLNSNSACHFFVLENLDRPHPYFLTTTWSWKTFVLPLPWTYYLLFVCPITHLAWLYETEPVFKPRPPLRKGLSPLFHRDTYATHQINSNKIIREVKGHMFCFHKPKRLLTVHIFCFIYRRIIFIYWRDTPTIKKTMPTICV